MDPPERTLRPDGQGPKTQKQDPCSGLHATAAPERQGRELEEAPPFPLSSAQHPLCALSELLSLQKGGFVSETGAALARTVTVRHKEVRAACKARAWDSASPSLRASD